MWWNPMTWGIPGWVKELISAIVELLKAILTQVGKDAAEKLTAKIKEVSAMSISGDEKRALVIAYAKELLPAMGTSALNLLIESVYNKLKENREV